MGNLKLDVPRFDGTKPIGWIFKINQFFNHHQLSNTQHLTIVSFYVEGPALGLFQWLFNNGLLHSWPEFLMALEAHFAPSQFKDPQGSFFKLTQTTTVRAYQTEFEQLANQVIGLPPQFLLSCFISGLKLDICREVLALQPLSLHQAIGLTKLQEDKYNSLRRYPPTRPLPIPNSSCNQISSPFLPLPVAISIKRLSIIEQQIRRKKGLCFRYDEKFHPGHKCQRKFMVLLGQDGVSISRRSYSTHYPSYSSS